MKKLFTFFVATMFAFSAFAAPFGITVNGTPVIGEENLMPMDPSYQEWYVFGQSLQVGDVVRLYDEGSGKEWAIDLDPAITVTITGGITEGFYTMGESGIFNFYLKLKQDADQLWIEKVGGVAPTPTTALAATNVTHNSFTANWVASNLEGATYNINVWNDDYDLIASASGLEETSYAVSNLDPESSYSYVVFVSVGEDESDASNSIEVTTLAKPAITPEQDEYQLFSDAGIEGSTSIIITAVNVAEATATVTGDAEFYFKDFNDNPVTTKTFAVEPEGPTEIELFSYFIEEGDYSATITISATDADEVTIPVTAVVTIPTEKIREQAINEINARTNIAKTEIDAAIVGYESNQDVESMADNAKINIDNFGNKAIMDITMEEDAERIQIIKDDALFNIEQRKDQALKDIEDAKQAASVVVAPTFTPEESEFEGSVEVTLACETEGAEIYFTVNGSTPDNETGIYYEGPFTLTATTTVKAVAYKDGKDSEITEKTYTKSSSTDINVINAEDVPNGAIIKDDKVYIIRDGKVYNLQGSEIKNADEILKSVNF